MFFPFGELVIWPAMATYEKWRYYEQDKRNITNGVIMRAIAIAILVLLLIIPYSSATIVYPYFNCEKVAKDNAESRAMGLVFIHELYDNGASKTGEYVGHWMNVKEIHGKKYYIDTTYQRIFSSKEEVSIFWGDITSQNGKNRQNEVFDLTVESPPFGIIYHYTSTTPPEGGGLLVIARVTVAKQRSSEAREL